MRNVNMSVFMGIRLCEYVIKRKKKMKSEKEISSTKFGDEEKLSLKLSA